MQPYVLNDKGNVNVNENMDVTVAVDKVGGICASGSLLDKLWGSLFRCNRCVCDPVASEVPPCGYSFPEVAVDLPQGSGPEVSVQRLQNALDRVQAKGQLAKPGFGDSHRSPLPSADRAAGRGHVRPANVPLLRLEVLTANQPQAHPASEQQHEELMNAFKELDDEAASFECQSPDSCGGTASTIPDSAVIAKSPDKKEESDVEATRATSGRDIPSGTGKALKSTSSSQEQPSPVPIEQPNPDLQEQQTPVPTSQDDPSKDADHPPSGPDSAKTHGTAQAAGADPAKKQLTEPTDDHSRVEYC